MIKQAGIDAQNATNPTAILFGSVTKVNPLEVNVDQRFTLTEDFLVLTERIARYEVSLKHGHQYEDVSDAGSTQRTTDEQLVPNMIVRHGLIVGDKVILLRVQGGQQYVIMDKAVGV